MNYEFHVGDYVETKCGHIGYVSKINQLSNGHTMLYICYTDGKTFPCDVVDRDVEHSFVHIGQYDFTRQDKKIEKMQITFTSSDYNDDGWYIKSIIELRKKINELIDTVNKLEEQNKGCSGCLHFGDQKYKCELCARFGHDDHYVSNG